jgi:hypothetical protein
MAGWYDNLAPLRFLALIDCSKTPALYKNKFFESFERIIRKQLYDPEPSASVQFQNSCFNLFSRPFRTAHKKQRDTGVP